MNLALQEEFAGVLQCDEPLSMHTWFQVGGPAEYYADPGDWETFLRLVRFCLREGVPFRLLGAGSNVLVRNEGIKGLVISLCESLPQKLEVEGNRVRVSSNVPLSRLVTTAVRNGLGGLEDLIGIPGTVGAALRGNIGTDSTDIGQFLKEAQVCTSDGAVIQIPASEVVFAYRQSSLSDSVILEAEFEFHEENPVELAHRMQKRWIVRKASQPLGHQGAGRIFRNVTELGESASALIERVGMAGTRVGGAMVCERHANYIVTMPECLPNDILRLIRLIQEQVQEHTGVKLALELEIWGE